mmetsp:Transcript_43700/g.49565  ORF Transcript_43700/g.49565 Transcript_43700/m.49565 type:complete len:491 (+) Transcript_43700:509-1981(+)
MGAKQSTTTKNTNGRLLEEDEDDNCSCFVLGKLLQNNKTKNKSKNALLGSPIMTPLMEKRRRNESRRKMGTFYNGLEREPSTVTVFPPKNHNSNNNDSDFETYQGKDSEKKMFLKYELLEVLGIGSTSTVYRCQNRLTKLIYACKVIDSKQQNQEYNKDENNDGIEQFHVEIDAMRELRHHPNIIKIYDVYLSGEDKIYIIMEHMEGGELFDYVVQKGTLTEEEASSIVRKVTSAVVYMHSKNIIHRDLKPENLLLTSKKKKDSNLNNNNKSMNGSTTANANKKGSTGSTSIQNTHEVKLIDFGLCKCLSPVDVTTSSFLGTRGYLAPEMLQRLEYNKAVDNWALGVIIFVLLCGCLPFDDDAQCMSRTEMDRTKRFRLRFPRWASNVSDSAKDLLSNLLHTEPNKRYTAEQALFHPWVQGRTASPSAILASPGRIQASPSLRAKMNNSPHNSNIHNIHQYREKRAAANNLIFPSSVTNNKRVLVRKKSI